MKTHNHKISSLPSVAKKIFNHKKKQNMELFQKSFVFDKLQVRSPSQTQGLFNNTISNIKPAQKCIGARHNMQHPSFSLVGCSYSTSDWRNPSRTIQNCFFAPLKAGPLTCKGEFKYLRQWDSQYLQNHRMKFFLKPTITNISTTTTIEDG